MIARVAAKPEASFPWKEIEDLERFRSPEWTRRILQDLSVPGPGTRQKEVAELLERYSVHPLKRLKGLEAALQQQFVGKDEVIRLVIVSAIAHQPLLLVGPPGTAKSRIVLKFCEGLGVGRTGEGGSQHTVFQYLLHGFTEPDEVLGTVDLAQLREKNPTFRRIRAGSITDAEVVFLDEVFRANSAILNALLTLINERRVFEAGESHPAKARLIYGAANTIPSPRQMEDLRAFYERFILRVESAPLPMTFQGDEPDPLRRELLRRGWASEVRDLRAGYRPAESAMAPVACLNDVLFLHRAATERWGGEDLDALQGVLREYHGLVKALSGGPDPPCAIDDRKLIRLFLAVRAHALHRHNGPPGREDLRLLKHTWNDLDSKQEAEEIVEKYLGGRHGS